MSAPYATPEAKALAVVIWTTSRADESTISGIGADKVAAAILSSDWLAQRDARVKAEALREAIAKVRWVYNLQCPVPPRVDGIGIEYIPGARMAHLWWQKVLGGALDDLAERADRIEARP